MEEREKNKAKVKISGKKAVSAMVSKIAQAESLEGLKASISAFAGFVGSYPKLKDEACRLLADTVMAISGMYMGSLPARKLNVRFIPPDAPPAVLMPVYVPMAEEADVIYDGLIWFLEKLDEFSEPMEDIVTVKEMNAVLDNAQKKFRILDIVAPGKPLTVVSLNYSHAAHNCECGISAAPGSRESIIFVYHPREVSPCDRVFIFAHEIGHSLHLALTGDVEIIPDKFDEFNETLDIKLPTKELKQEAFADVAAFAMLNGGGLNKHLPHQFSASTLECFDKYIEYVTRSQLDLPF